MAYVRNIHTPLLIVHSEEDLRCPIEQAEQLFTALKQVRRDVRFVRFPGENHDLSRSGKPSHRLQRFGYILDWFAVKRLVRGGQTTPCFCPTYNPSHTSLSRDT